MELTYADLTIMQRPQSFYSSATLGRPRHKVIEPSIYAQVNQFLEISLIKEHKKKQIYFHIDWFGTKHPATTLIHKTTNVSV